MRLFKIKIDNLIENKIKNNQQKQYDLILTD